MYWISTVLRVDLISDLQCGVWLKFDRFLAPDENIKSAFQVRPLEGFIFIAFFLSFKYNVKVK
jgi:hypothetical protein